MNKRAFILSAILGIFVICLWAVVPVSATPRQPQLYINTPTADPSGRIIYIVKAGDTCISISLITGVSLDELRLLNNIRGDECNLAEGQRLLLGIVQKPTQSSGPTQIPTALLPMPTFPVGNSELCVVLFNDVNGNAMAEETEKPLAGGAISISDKLGKFNRTGKTSDGVDPVCFSDVPEGEYTVSLAVPDGYNATTIVNYQLQIKAGDKAILDFGAQTKAQVQIPTQSQGGGTTSSSNTTPILAIFGGLLVIAGIGLGIYVRWLSKQA